MSYYIIVATAYKDGFAFQSKNTSYVLLIPRIDLATLAFDGVRTGEIPIVGMEGHEFEYFCADILEKNGFTNVSVARGSGDQGVDVLATKDGIKYAILPCAATHACSIVAS